ncbi:Tetratricopeptide-like helical [Penicillium concentricum]|uniref:Tetratricopeptide-like helical n=1 Tax=Penicillium concentricum TaxID=293559 RepID=A0A9W9RH58_9EURO|nr:Tetratricopeptide-like helical [Penicillium concentricum]KAJ5360198.1 Tetratricopeptide-like helical [Penicillium concentricum]
MSSQKIASLWTEAIKQYETIAKQKLDPVVLRVTTVNDLLEVIDEENKQFNAFRDRGHRLRDVLKHAMAPIELVGTVVAGGVSAAYPPSTYVFGAVTLLLEAAKGVSDKYDAIIETMSTLKDLTIRLKVYSGQTISENLSNKLTEILTSLLEVLAFARKEVKHGRMLSYGKSLLSGSDGGKEAMARFSRLVEAESALVGAETLTEVKGGFARVNSDMKKIARQLEETRLQSEMPRKERMAANLRLLLQPSRSSEDRYRTMNRNRVPQTGDWIQEETEFIDWIAGKKPVLWISGNPGAGKSYIATNMIDHLKQKPHVSLGFFFFKDDDPTTRSTHQALRDIAFQIALKDPLYAEYIVDCLDCPEDIGTLESLWRNLFLNFFIDNGGKEDGRKSAEGPVYLVLDALDEAFINDRLELFELAKDIQAGGRIQLLMLGRPQIAEEMNDLMETLQIQTIDVSEVNNFEDIVHYIKTIIAKSIYLRKLPPSTQRTIIQRLSTGSQGMFLWVGLMLQDLSQIRSKGDIQRTLDEAPKGLTKMISHVLKGFSESFTENPQYAADLNELLAWTMCTPTPLSLFEIDALLKWRSPEGESWIWLEGSLRVQFASIFLLTREDGLSTADLKRRMNYTDYGDLEETPECDSEENEEFDSNDDFDSDHKTTTVSFCHASLGEFFRSQEGKVSAGPNSPPIGVNYHEARILVLNRCFEIIQNKEESREQIALALRSYACSYIVQFLTAVDMSQITKDTKRAIGFQLAELLSDESGFEAFVSPDELNFFSQDALGILNKWLGDPDVQEALPDETKIWYSNAMAESPAEILRPIASYIASHWVRNTSWCPAICLLIIRDFIAFQSSGPSLDATSVENVLQIADWGQPEHDAHWYGRVGQALERLAFYDGAIEYLQKALQIDPELWEFRSQMACLYRDIGESAKALEIHQTNINLINEKEQSFEVRKVLHHEYERVADCYLRLTDKENAFSVLQKAYNSYNHCAECARLILEHYHGAGKVDQILDLFQMMNEKSPSEGVSHLTEFMLKNPDIGSMMHEFGAKIIRRGCFSFFKEAFTAAIIIARRQKKAILTATLELSLSSLLSSLGVDPEGGARIWERILETYKPSQAKSNLHQIIFLASSSLCCYYFKQCCRDDCSEVERQRYGELLERLVMGRPLHLARHERTTKAVTEYAYLPRPEARATLGTYYKMCGRDDDALQFFRSLLQLPVLILGLPDDDENRNCYLQLAGIFAAMRDVNNWVSAWYQIAFLNEKIGDTNAPRPFCDGCGTLCTIDGIAHCWRHDMPFSVLFCEECFPRLKDGSLSVDICDPTHEFMIIPTRPQSVKERSIEHQAMMYVCGEWMTCSDWKLSLKEQYGLEEE